MEAQTTEVLPTQHKGIPARRVTLPSVSLLEGKQYTLAHRTDIRVTFEKAQAIQADAHAQEVKTWET